MTNFCNFIKNHKILGILEDEICVSVHLPSFDTLFISIIIFMSIQCETKGFYYFRLFHILEVCKSFCLLKPLVNKRSVWHSVEFVSHKKA